MYKSCGGPIVRFQQALHITVNGKSGYEYGVLVSNPAGRQKWAKEKTTRFDILIQAVRARDGWNWLTFTHRGVLR
jgi:hypothetical protein